MDVSQLKNEMLWTRVSALHAEMDPLYRLDESLHRPIKIEVSRFDIHALDVLRDFDRSALAVKKHKLEFASLSILDEMSSNLRADIAVPSYDPNSVHSMADIYSSLLGFQM